MSKVVKIDSAIAIQVPCEVSGFYISRAGFLCARCPVKVTLSDESLLQYGITGASQIAIASTEQCNSQNLVHSKNVKTLILSPI